MDQARLSCHLSGAFTGLLDVRHMRCELIVFDRGVPSLGLLVVCLSFRLEVCLPSHHFTRCTYRRSLCPLVNSYTGALAAASLLNW
jgi:hypothetical protein